MLENEQECSQSLYVFLLVVGKQYSSLQPDQRGLFFGDRHSQGILLLHWWNDSSSKEQPVFWRRWCLSHLSQEGERGTEQTQKVIFGGEDLRDCDWVRNLPLPLLGVYASRLSASVWGYRLVGQAGRSVSAAGRGGCCWLVKASNPQGWKGVVFDHTWSNDAAFITCTGNCWGKKQYQNSRINDSYFNLALFSSEVPVGYLGKQGCQQTLTASMSVSTWGKLSCHCSVMGTWAEEETGEKFRTGIPEELSCLLNSVAIPLSCIWKIFLSLWFIWQKDRAAARK